MTWYKFKTFTNSNIRLSLEVHKVREHPLLLKLKYFYVSFKCNILFDNDPTENQENINIYLFEILINS